MDEYKMRSIFFCTLCFLSQTVYSATFYYGQDLELNPLTNSFVSDNYITLDETNNFDLHPVQFPHVFSFLVTTTQGGLFWAINVPLNNYTSQTGIYSLDDYANVENFLFGNAVLSLSINNYFDMDFGGYYEILEIDYHPETVSINSLAVDFHLLIEGDDYFGALRYNSDIPISAVPLPATIWLFISGITGLGLSAQRKRILRKESQ